MKRDWMRELRKKHHITQQAMAKAVGVSRTSVQSWERGDVSPSPLHRVAIANLIGRSALNKFQREDEAKLQQGVAS